MRIQSKVTIVTAYYKIKSKASPEKYEEWISNMLPNIKTSMVIFTDNESLDIIKKYRKDKSTTTIILLEKQDFKVSRIIPSDQWEYQYQIDHEKYHSPDLYKIWNEKSSFVKKAIKLNPFNSDIFVWCDIGCFRRKQLIERYINWPSADKLSDGKVSLLVVEKFDPQDMIIQENGLPRDFRYVNRICGAIFAGNKQAFIKWEKAYLSVLKSFVENKRFYGKDQSIMATTAIKFPELVNLINVPNHLYGDDRWFYFHEYFL